MNHIDASMVAPLPPKPDAPNSPKEAAQQAEAMFVRTLLKEVRKAMPKDGLLNSPEMAMFQDMLDDNLATQISESGQLGLASAIEEAMTGLPTGGPARARRAYQRHATDVHGTPVHGHITSGFGERHHPILHKTKMHYGVDIGAPRGTAIRAMREGVVTHSGPRGTYGNLVIVDHGDGVQTRYAHARDLLVKPGQRVARGQTLATVGSTGRSTGPHLHFEVRKDGKPIDPTPYLKGGSAIDPQSDPTLDR